MYEQLPAILEAALLAANKSMTAEHLQKLFVDENLGADEQQVPSIAEIKQALVQIEADYTERAIYLKEVATGFRFQVRQELAPWIRRLWEEKPPRYSRALLETLVLIAYRQPITRAEIEDVRGVAVSTSIIKTLLEREWVRVVGHRDVPGKPALYASTKQFLAYFNIKSLDELPTLAEVQDLESAGQQMELALQSEEIPATVAIDDADFDAAVAAELAALDAEDIAEREQMLTEENIEEAVAEDAELSDDVAVLNNDIEVVTDDNPDAMSDTITVSESVIVDDTNLSIPPTENDEGGPQKTEDEEL